MGSISDRPTDRPPGRSDSTAIAIRRVRTFFTVSKTWGPALVAVVTSAVSAYAFVEAEIRHRIDSAIEVHSVDWTNTSHPSLRKKIEVLDDELEKARAALDLETKKSEALYKALYEMYWFRVGEKAVELETNRGLRAQMRARVQAQFVALVKDGESLEDAYRRALSQAAGLP